MRKVNDSNVGEHGVNKARKYPFVRGYNPKKHVALPFCCRCLVEEAINEIFIRCSRCLKAKYCSEACQRVDREENEGIPCRVLHTRSLSDSTGVEIKVHPGKYDDRYTRTQDSLELHGLSQREFHQENMIYYLHVCREWPMEHMIRGPFRKFGELDTQLRREYPINFAGCQYTELFDWITAVYPTRYLFQFWIDLGCGRRIAISIRYEHDKPVSQLLLGQQWGLSPRVYTVLDVRLLNTWRNKDSLRHEGMQRIRARNATLFTTFTDRHAAMTFIETSDGNKVKKVFTAVEQQPKGLQLEKITGCLNDSKAEIVRVSEAFLLIKDANLAKTRVESVKKEKGLDGKWEARNSVGIGYISKEDEEVETVATVMEQTT
ncbi:hypothetical protein CC78DRAFT_574563 [Lojkania enalia]|uniref:MYND-type domain-containing protein n=1 Tax=Lojkania enalia TaxID=147567 RepID=A0A9P4NAW8_9PLEO|nr:hypothetical protein CC78DRAFT_574563 [Didymosphaeria enalia]